MKVLFVVPHNIIHETRMFLGLKAKGVDARVVAGVVREPDCSRLREAGIPVTHIPFQARLDRKAIGRLRAVLAEFEPDIVHAFNNKTVSNALAACKGRPVRFVAYRGIVGNVSFLNPASWLTYLNPRVDRIVCVADAIRDSLLELRFGGLKIPAYKPVTIYKGHDLAWYQAPAADLGEFGISQGKFVVGCIANYRPRKGIKYLVDAAGLLSKHPDIHFLLIGDMHDRGLLKRIERSPARDRLHLTGPRTDAPQIQAACNACILPSIKREGLPKAVIEGMAYGVPPIVTDSGGSPELIEHDISGLVVPPASAEAIAGAVERLYRNPDRCRQMGEAARVRIRDHFSTDNTIEQTFELYRQLMRE